MRSVIVVPSWRGTGSFRPVLTAHVAGPRGAVVASLAESLRRRRLRLGYRGADGFRLTYRSWWDVLGLLQLDVFSFTRLRLTAAPAPDGTHVTIAVEEDDAVRARGPVTDALGAAFTELEQRGYAVRLGTWASPG